MREITDIEMAHNLGKVLDRVEFEREELVVIRNHHEIARIIPGPARLTATEAMTDLYRTMPESAAAEWLEDSRRGEDEGTVTGTLGELRDPWES